MHALEREIQRCRFKLGLCVRLARQSSRDSWQHAESPKQRREYLRMRRESINDICGARWWRRKLHELGATP